MSRSKIMLASSSMLVAVIALLLYVSMMVSQRRSNEFVYSLPNDHYLFNKSIKITAPNTNSNKVGLYWVFHYQKRGVFDADIYITVSLLGNVMTEIVKQEMKSEEGWKSYFILN
jgi:hypothetical protein